MRTSLSVLLVGAVVWAAFTQPNYSTLRPAGPAEYSKTEGQPFESIPLFRPSEKEQASQGRLKDQISSYRLLSLDEEQLQRILAEKPESMTLTFPGAGGGEIEVELERAYIFADEFVVTESGTNAPARVHPGVHYRGALRGENGSLAAFSFFEQEVMGMMSSPLIGNRVLGRLQEKDLVGEYILYDDRDLPASQDFFCATPDDGPGYTADDLRDAVESRGPGDCVRIYFEVDYDIFLNKGGTTPTTNYVTGLFNQVAALYSNESVSVIISEIFIWTTSSPYSGSSSSQMLSQFQNYRTSFNGNLAQLLSYKASGGIAVLNGLCHPYTSARMSFSSISSSYNSFPTYSWTVMVVTHELGHLLGSHHTHACVWNGNNTALDGCAGFTEGSCSTPGIPSGGGTIMSYCHLTSAGINFSQGFGTQPGNVIRNKVNQVTCTQACPTGGGGGGGGGGGNPTACNGNQLILTLVIDNYGPETTWELKSSSGAVLFEGGPYPKGQAGAIFRDTFCLADGCYQFRILDEYGDGICCQYGQGSYNLVDEDGNVVASGGQFGAEETTNFCLPSGGGGGGGDDEGCITITNFNDVTINSYGGNQDVGTYQLQSGGTVLKLSGNAWKAIPLNYNITSNTVLEFDFGSTSQGEIHGIGFDDDNEISYYLTFKLFGTQNWGILNYNNYPGNSTWRPYVIPVGQFYTGTADRLFFAADHDVAYPTGNSYFRNIKIYEGNSCENAAPEAEVSLFLEEGTAPGLALFPNPAGDYLQLVFEGADEGGAAMKIFNMTGQMVREQRYNTLPGQNAERIDISNLAQGTYLLKMDIDGQAFAEKFTVLRQ
jgi:hypothetical protein